MTTHPPLASRAVRLTLSSLVCSGLLLATMTNAEAQSPHRARMSQDLEQRLLTGDTEVTSVIVTGSSERIARVAARHGLVVRELLETGAVLDVPAGTLEALASDSEVDHLSTNYLVEAHMGVTNQTIGADVVQAGGWAPGIGAFTGRRHRRRGDRYRRSDDAGAARAHHREPRLHRRARSGDRRARARDARGRESSRRRV